MDSDNWIKTNAQKLKYYVGYFLDATPSKAAEAEHYVKRNQNKSALRHFCFGCVLVVFSIVKSEANQK